VSLSAPVERREPGGGEPQGGAAPHRSPQSGQTAPQRSPPAAAPHRSCRSPPADQRQVIVLLSVSVSVSLSVLSVSVSVSV